MTDRYVSIDEKTGENTENIFPPNGIERFGERLKMAIGKESVNSFAKRCGISEGTIRKYLSGNTYPGIDKMHALAESTGKSISWLISGDTRELVIKDEADEMDLLKWWGIIFESLSREEKQMIITQYQRHGVNALFAGIFAAATPDKREILRRDNSTESTRPAPSLSTQDKKVG